MVTQPSKEGPEVELDREVEKAIQGVKEKIHIRIGINSTGLG